MDDTAMKAGLLLEAAQAQQTLAESLLAGLRAQVEGLDTVARDEIRRTLVDELSTVVVESRRAAEAIRSAGHAGRSRQALWTLGVAGICTCLPVAITRWILPSSSEIAALESRRASLVSRVAELERRGGEVQLKSCGEGARLCVRVDRTAPAYGPRSDWYVVAGP